MRLYIFLVPFLRVRLEIREWIITFASDRQRRHEIAIDKLKGIHNDSNERGE